MLRAVGLPSQVLMASGLWRLVVPAEVYEAARTELIGYEDENRNWPPPKVRPAHRSSGRREAVVYGLLMVLFHPIGQAGLFGRNWWAAGRIAADRVREGELWRAMTALTLHVDLSHLAGNLLFGCLFGIVASQSLGPGLVWAGALLAGFLGNLINVALQEDSFRAVGASTAVFGILGLMSLFEALRRDSPGTRTLRSLGPILGGAVLLGFLGMGGGESTGALDGGAPPPSRVDVGAHAFGFLVGGVLGALAAWTRLPDRVGPRNQHLLAALALVPLAVAWLLALR